MFISMCIPPPPPLPTRKKMADGQGLLNITFVEFVNGQHLELFSETRGKEEITKGLWRYYQGSRLVGSSMDHGCRL